MKKRSLAAAKAKEAPVEESALYPDQPRSEPEPHYFERDAHRAPHVVPAERRAVEPSQMFMIKLLLDEFRRAHPGETTFDASQGDGGASLGGIPKPELTAALEAYLSDRATTAYGPAGGRSEVRAAALENWWGFGPDSGLGPERVVFTNGGRGALQIWYTIVNHFSGPGSDVIVSAAPWPTYPHALYLNNLNMLCAPGTARNAFRLTPDALRETVAYAQTRDRSPRALILTSPDNPTGNYLDETELVALIETARELGIRHVLLDLMYQAVTTRGRYDASRLWSRLTPEARAGLTFLDGLTKCAGASSVRNAHLLVGNAEEATLALAAATHLDVVNDLGMALASSIYLLPDPCDHIWIRRVVDPTNRSRAIAVKQLREAGIRLIADEGYYAFVNIWPWLGRPIPPELRWTHQSGYTVTKIDDVKLLIAYLAKQFGLAVVPGSAFCQPAFIRFSVAQTPEYTRSAVTRLVSALRALE